MNLEKLSVGKNPPEEINVAIEIPAGAAPVKYELDKDSGALVCLLYTSPSPRDIS